MLSWFVCLIILLLSLGVCILYRKNKDRCKKVVAMVVAVGLLSSCLLFIPTGDPPISWEWTIDGDTVFINNSKVYLSAGPHTIVDDGWVEFELESKVFSGEVDAIWGFNTTNAKPKTPQIWRNYTHNMSGYHDVEQHLDIIFTNCLSYEVLNIIDYDNYNFVLGNKNNTKLWNITYNDTDSLEGFEILNITIAFTSKTVINATSIQFFYYDEVNTKYYYDSTFFDWKTFDKDITVKTYSWQGCNKWYSVNASIQQDKLYRVRCWVDIPFGGLNGTSGKYIWAIKEHNKTMQEAIDSGRLLYLDPWYDSSWLYSKSMQIEDKEASYAMRLVVEYDDGIDVSANVSCESHCNADFSDLRFLDSNATELSHYILNYTSSKSCEVWINTSTTNVSNVDMYYGNAVATDNSEGNDTFIAFDDETWSDDWSVDPKYHGGSFGADEAVKKIHDNSGKQTTGVGSGATWDRYDHYSTGSVDNDFAIDYYIRVKIGNYYMIPHSGSADHSAGDQIINLKFEVTTQNIEYYDGAWQYVTEWGLTTWHKISFTDINFGTDTFDIYVDGVLYIDDGGFRNDLSEMTYLQIGTTSDNQIAYIDAFRVRKWKDNEPYWSAFGTEQSEPVSVIYPDAVRTTGEDYFIWLGENVTATQVANLLDNESEITWSSDEYIAIWYIDGVWDADWYMDGVWYQYHPHNTSGFTWSINTFDVVRIYVTDNLGTCDFNMTKNADMDYSAGRYVELANKSGAYGANFTGYTASTATTLSAIATATSMSDGEVLAVWSQVDYDYDDIYVAGFGGTDATINQYDIVYTMIGAARYWTLGGV